MDIKEEGLFGSDDQARHWYYRAKLAALRSVLAGGGPPGPLLDVGAGSGFFSRALLQEGLATEATCVDPAYAADRDEEVGGKPLRFRRVAPPGAREAARTVLMMDVLEHVADDAALAREYAAACGARVIATVPAFMWLWSDHDEFLGHYRRYTLQRLESVLETAGLRVEVGCYCYAAVLPAVAALRLARRLPGRSRAALRSDMRVAKPIPNSLLLAACSAETRLMRLNRLGGLTAIARAVKL